MAELLFRGWLAPDADVTVSSAGTQAVVGHGIDHSSASALGQLGIDPSRHRARQFQTWMAADADLILTAARDHRDQVITELPSVHKRAFTMKEFVRLAAGVSRGEARAVVAGVAGRRGPTELVPAVEDDVRDPYRDTIKYAKTIAEEITETVYATLDALGFAAERWTIPRPERERAVAERPSPY